MTHGGAEDSSLQLRASLGIHGRSAAHVAVPTVTRGRLGNRFGSLMVDGRLSTVPANKTRGFTFHRPRATTTAFGPALAKDYYHVEGDSDTDDDTMAPPDLKIEPGAGTAGVSLKVRPRRARPATTPMRRYAVSWQLACWTNLIALVHKLNSNVTNAVPSNSGDTCRTSRLRTKNVLKTLVSGGVLTVCRNGYAYVAYFFKWHKQAAELLLRVR